MLKRTSSCITKAPTLPNSSLLISFPFSVISPLRLPYLPGFYLPQRTFKREVLPQPEGPKIPTISLGFPIPLTCFRTGIVFPKRSVGILGSTKIVDRSILGLVRTLFNLLLEPALLSINGARGSTLSLISKTSSSWSNYSFETDSVLRCSSNILDSSCYSFLK